MKAKRPFKKLLSLIRLNTVSMDANGEFTVLPTSSTNKERMNLKRGLLGKGKVWEPRKLYLTEQDLIEKWKEQGEVCYWFKIPLNFDLLYQNSADYFPRHPLAPSVDRIDDSGDYTKENIVICCRLSNQGRNVFPFDKYHEVIRLIKGETTVNSITNFC
jgi:hypothetical protein